MVTSSNSEDHKVNWQKPVYNSYASRKFTTCLQGLYRKAKTGCRQRVAGPRVHAFVRNTMWRALGFSTEVQIVLFKGKSARFW